MIAPSSSASRRARIGLPLGPGLALVLGLLPPPADFPPEAWRTAAVATWMAVWWISEAVPVWSTALLPMVLFPLAGLAGSTETARSYAHPVLFLFLGGFLLAAAMREHELHRRLALHLLGRVGTSPRRIVLGFMGATAFLSAWVSNTATAAMMVPLALSVVQLAGDAREDLGRPLVLGVAYAASIGGLATLIGTPPNALLAGFLSETYGIELAFGRWLLLGVPLAAVLLPTAWWLLVTRLAPVGREPLPGGAELVRRELAALGTLSTGERSTAIVFAAMALAWTFRPLLQKAVPPLSDAGIAMLGGIALFALPAGRGRRVLDARAARLVPWDVLVLFGGGLALAGAFRTTGLADALGGLLSGAGAWPLPLLMVAVTALLVFLTELTSNTASAAAFLPVVGALAVGIGADPPYLAVPAALAASCAFMLPVATPPNAIAFASGHVTVPEMARAGLVLNVIFLFLVPLVAGLALRLLPVIP
jgi:sodium-dependent dicarboxylate transporter 2/3/5